MERVQFGYFFFVFFPLVFFCSSGETLRSVLSYLKRREGGIKILSNRTADLPVVTERAASERSSLAPKCR